MFSAVARTVVEGRCMVGSCCEHKLPHFQGSPCGINLYLANVLLEGNVTVITTAYYAWICISHPQWEADCKVWEPRCKEAAVGPSEYSQCRVWSPLVELTARHKKSLCWLLDHRTILGLCHNVWLLDTSALGQGISIQACIWLSSGSRVRGQNTMPTSRCRLDHAPSPSAPFRLVLSLVGVRFGARCSKVYSARTIPGCSGKNSDVRQLSRTHKTVRQ